jgi:hypothetical protein
MRVLSKLIFWFFRICFLNLLFLLILWGCNKKSPCHDLNNGVYLYPTLPKNNTMTSEERDKFMDLPNEVAKCMSTEGLIESILTYPYVGLMFAGSTSQSGYVLLKSKFRGPGELESRPDRGKSLLKKYQEWNPIGFDKSWENIKIGQYMARGVYLEIIQSQYINLENLDSTDLQNMFLRSLEVYDLEKTELEYFGYFALTFSTTTISRIMYKSNYTPFVSLYNTNLAVQNITEFYRPSDSSAIKTIHQMALEYSKNFKK